MQHVPNHELPIEAIPPTDAPLHRLRDFAGTFIPFEHWKDTWDRESYQAKSSALLGDCIERYQKNGVLPDSLSELRTCLALEWAMLPYVAPSGPNEKLERFLRDLVEKIRALVTMGRLD